MKASRELFCVEYVKDFKGAQAAIRAGYSEKGARQAASYLLTNRDVKARVTELSKAVLAQPIDDLKAKIRNEYEKIAFATLGDVLDDEMRIDPAKVRDNGLIKEMRVMREKIITSGDDDDERAVHETLIEVKLHDKLVALAQLAKYADLVKDQGQPLLGIDISDAEVVIRISTGRRPDAGTGTEESQV